MINEASEDESKATQSTSQAKEEVRYVDMHCIAADLAYIKDRDFFFFENRPEKTVSSPIVDCSNL